MIGIAARCALIFTVGLASPVLADPDKDESGHGRRGHYGHEYKEEFWDGNCKVERKLEKNGNYKEERKCRGGPYHGDAVPVGPAPGVYVYPPAVVIQPPAVIIR